MQRIFEMSRDQRPVGGSRDSKIRPTRTIHFVLTFGYRYSIIFIISVRFLPISKYMLAFRP